MKGLIIKDLMCLRKQRITFWYVMMCVAVLSVMFVLSARFGNLAMMNRDMMVQNDISEMDIKNMCTIALIFFMMLPIALVGDISTLVIEDGKAGFARVSSILPLSIEKRVLAKFLTIALRFGLGVLMDLVLAFVLSLLTDIISFREFGGIIISLSSIMFLDATITVMLCFWFGYGKEDYAQIISILVLVCGVILVNFNTIRQIFQSIVAGGVGNMDFMNEIMDLIKFRSHILLIWALGAGVVFYVLSVVIAKKKRGII